MRLVINHYLPYKTPLQLLMRHIAKLNISSLILIAAGSHMDGVVSCDTNHMKVTVVLSKSSNWDYHGFTLLHQYRNDTRIQSENYFMLHDTCRTHPGFPGVEDVDLATYDVLAPRGATSNIFAFSSNALTKLAESIRPMSKADAVSKELSREMFHGLKVKSLKPRICRGRVDVYNTSHPRLQCYYPDFFLDKFISFGTMGDIDGHFRSNGYGRRLAQKMKFTCASVPSL